MNNTHKNDNDNTLINTSNRRKQIKKMLYHPTSNKPWGRIISIVGLCALVLVVAGVDKKYHIFTHSHHSVVTSQAQHKPVDSEVSYFNSLPKLKRSKRLIHIKNMNAKSAIVIDNTSHRILYNKNSHELRKIASVSKLMTLYLVQRKAQHDHAWLAPVTINKNVQAMSKDTKHGLSSYRMNHKTYTVKQLYHAAVLESSNSAAIALGEWVSGSNKQFIQLMNKQAKAWHLKARFVSASGLENDSISPYGLKVCGKKKSGNEVSAWDVDVITRHLLREFPGIVGIASSPSDTDDNKTIKNSNPLLKGGLYYQPQLHIDGLKSGFTPSAGPCYVGTGKPYNTHHRIITIVLHDQNYMKDTDVLMKDAGLLIKNRK